MTSQTYEMGFFGNVWVRQHKLEKAGDVVDTHEHQFDHVSLLTNGTARIEVEGYEPKEFVAPTFIIIKKEHKHKLIAVTDDVNWYCVFALRDIDGEVVDLYQNKHDPTTLIKNY
jgi:hypothetical protein